MEFKAPSEEFMKETQDNLLEGFQNEETFAYLKKIKVGRI